MIRQSKTTIKELSAQYRSVLRHAFLAGVVALTTSVANANTDVTFAGDYVASTGIENVATGTPAAYNFTYTGTNQDGTATATINSNTTNGVDMNDFAYTLANGTSETLDAGNTYTASDYTASTVAGTTGYTAVVVADGYGLNAGTSVVDSAYSYENPQYDSTDPESQQYITLDSNGSARELSASYATNATYTAGSTDITSGTVATDLISLYSYQPEGGHTYVLSNDGTGIKDLDNDGQAVDLTNPAIDPDLLVALQGMLDAYATDSGTALTAATDALGDLQTTENANYAAALSAYNTDTAAQETLVTNFATYTAANNAYTSATNAESNYQQALTNFGADTEKFNAASDVYNSPIETTIDTRAQSVAESVVANETTARETADTTLQSNIDAEVTRATGEEAAIRSEFAAADATLQSNIDAEVTRATGEEAAIRSEFAAADATLQNAIDNEIARATAQEAAIRNDFAAADAATLARANAYTDQKVDSLEKNVSGGVAAATALSAVAVSNVGKGEVSFGGGYGYYNNQSAVALGAAMGLTNRWSVNVGAGLATGDKTQMALRAGTNYKFKLF